MIVKPHYQDYWTIPGGVIERHESPLQAAVRKVNEEIGLDVKIDNLLGVNYLECQLGDKKYDSYQFCVSAKVINSHRQKTDGEIEDKEWVKPGEVESFLGGSSVNLVNKRLEARANKTVAYFESKDIRK